MSSDPSTPRTILRAPITFDAADGSTTHAPMVIATIGALRTRLVLDTGADVHLLTREVADEVGLTMTSFDTGTDHGGDTVDSWLAGDAPIELDGAAGGPAELMLREIVVIPAPAAFLKLGIGGGLSPQRLHPTAWAIIDGARRELLLVEGSASSIAGLLAERDPARPVLELERLGAAALPIVAAAIEPHPPRHFLVNTGGRHTEVEPGVAPGLVGGNLERIGAGVSGADILGAEAGSQVLAIAGRRVALPSVKLRSPIGDPPAMLGQDVLAGTVVAVGPDPGTPLLWQVATLA